MQLITDGPLRSNHIEQLYEAGFTSLQHPAPLAGVFATLNLTDVTSGACFGYDWQLYAAVVIATDSGAPWRATPHHCEGVAELSSVTMPVTSYGRLSDQFRPLFDSVRAQFDQAEVPPAVRAWNQVAGAEWYLRKAQGARQGIWDRLYRDRLLDGMDRDERARLVAWMLRFGSAPMAFRAEQAAHDRAAQPITAALLDEYDQYCAAADQAAIERDQGR